MLQGDRAELTAMLTAVAEVHGRTISDGMVSIWMSALGDLTIEQVASGMQAHLRSPEGRFFPTPAHIMDAVRGDSDAAATRALAQLQGAIRDHGWPTPITFKDPIINRVVVALGGWVAVCQMPSEMLLPHFRKAYVPLHKSGAKADLEKTQGYLPRSESAPLKIGQVLHVMGGE